MSTVNIVNDWFRAELRSKSLLTDSIIYKGGQFELLPEIMTKEVRARISRRYFFELGYTHD